VPQHQMPELRPQNYLDERPAADFQEFHERSRTHPAGWIYELVRLILTPIALLIYRCRAISVPNVPGDGPLILAPNHFSNMDHFFAGVFLRRKIRFMGKSQLFRQNRILDYILLIGGVFPVRRGHRDEEAFKTAHAILDNGGCLLIYAEGGRSRSGKLGDPRPGVGRLALESGVPVVPVAIHGSQSVRAWKRLVFPKVTVQYGEPLVLDRVAAPTREQQLEASTEIFDRVRSMYVALEENGRKGVVTALQARGQRVASSQVQTGRKPSRA